MPRKSALHSAKNRRIRLEFLDDFSPAARAIVSATPTSDTRDPRLDWPDRKEAAARKGVSTTTIRNLEKRKLLTPVRVGGIFRYDPEELEDVEAADSNEIKLAELLSAAVMLVKQAQDHSERLVSLITVPSQQLQASFDKIHERQTSRVEVLEVKNAEMLSNAEQALSLQHERHMEEKKLDASEKRKSMAFEQVSKHIPEVVKAALKRIAGMAGGAPNPGEEKRARTDENPHVPPSKTDIPKPSHVTAVPNPPASPAPPAAPIDDDEAAFQVHVVLAKLTDEQIDMMTTAGFVNLTQAHAFKQYRRSMEKDADASAIEAKGESVPESKED